MTNGINGAGGGVYARPNIELRGYDKRAKSPDTVIVRMSAAASACRRALF